MVQARLGTVPQCREFGEDVRSDVRLPGLGVHFFEAAACAHDAAIRVA